ncbi:HAD-IIB family hydrolase [Mesoplasma melaleucae]|uniref:Haloacid dehalogenase n=1 Tax=Mesoplasma melaleucae TaxID=81459 RepID=A0A2K8NWT8_9MOLU|nr:HAD-IIB family hydrolase [Mesoplasma melaleucae]ATZ18204.1 haloacid dehalogenase [Mesoplasma melaleucae]
MNEIKLLVLDMDGTSYHNMGNIIESNIKPLQDAIKIGTKVAFVTGRPVLAKPNNLKEHNLAEENAILIGCNAGCIYDLNTETVLKSNPIKSDQAKKLFEAAKNTKIILWGYVDDLNTVILSKKVADVNNEECHWEGRFFDGEYLIYDDVKDNFNFNFFKILGFHGNYDFYNQIEADLNLNISTNDGKLAEINAPGINKKFAIDWLSDYFNIPIKNIAAMGDGMNDLPMIKHAGIGVALKNSEQQIKDAAQIYIDKENTEGAVAEFVNKYILKK